MVTTFCQHLTEKSNSSNFRRGLLSTLPRIAVRGDALVVQTVLDLFDDNDLRTDALHAISLFVEHEDQNALHKFCQCADNYYLGYSVSAALCRLASRGNRLVISTLLPWLTNSSAHVRNAALAHFSAASSDCQQLLAAIAPALC